MITDLIPAEMSNVVVQETPDAGVTLTRTTGISYEWTVSDLTAGQGGTITLSGLLSEPLAAGSFTNTATITGTTTDPDPGNNIASVTILVSNAAPALDPIGPQTVAETETLTFTATATDPNGNDLTFGLSDGPTGATISPTTGLFTWATDEDDGPGVYSATVVVSDGVLTDSETIDITVTEDNQAPVLAAIPPQTITETETLTFTATATDTNGDSLTFSLSDGPRRRDD